LGREGEVVFDASGKVLGRLSSLVAKRLLEGQRVTVINAEKAVVTGERRRLIRDYMTRLEIKGRVHPRHTPAHPRQPDTLLRRGVRGMLPRRKSSGLAAYRRLRVYVGTPSQETATAEQAEEALYRSRRKRSMTLGELCREMGWRG